MRGETDLGDVNRTTATAITTTILTQRFRTLMRRTVSLFYVSVPIATFANRTHGFALVHIYSNRTNGRMTRPVRLSGGLTNNHVPSQVWSWGSGKFGCLGLGDDESRWFPSRIPLFAESQPVTVEAVSAGKWHVLCRTHKTHEVYAWGRNNWGQASEPSRVCSTFPWLSGRVFWHTAVSEAFHASLCAETRDDFQRCLSRRQLASPASRRQLFSGAHVRAVRLSLILVPRSSQRTTARHRGNRCMRTESRSDTMDKTGNPAAGFRRS